MAEKINIGGRVFWGYYTLDNEFKKEPGIYVIMNGQQIDPVDVGQTDNLNTRPRHGHDREGCWKVHCPNGIYVAAVVESSPDARTLIERLIREQYYLPCGER